MTRKECLDAAAGCVLKDRQNQYGGPENNFERIAQMWNGYLGTNSIKPWDVAAMMGMLKMARARFNPKYADNWVDMAGYAACGIECATAQEEFDKGLDEFQKKQVERMLKDEEGMQEDPPLCGERCEEYSPGKGLCNGCRHAPEKDAPQTKEELIERIKSANPAIYGAHVE